MTESAASDARVRILVVDDEAPVRNSLSRLLRACGYETDTAGSGPEALDRLRREPATVMLLDICMPGATGIEVVPQALEIDPDLAILMLTALDDATNASLCMQRGALDYLTKPIEHNDLTSAIARAIKRRDTLLQDHEISAWAKEELTLRTRELERAGARLEEVTVATLEALVNALEAKNAYLVGHSARVAVFAATIANEFGRSDDEIEQVRIAGRLHDLGMIGIREAVLDKEGPLTEEEYAHVKQHVAIGAQILAPLTHLGPVVSLVRSHHEHWDGTGYPDMLAGEDIPLGGRIICAAEIYDALTTTRPYRESLTPEQAVVQMQEFAGSSVDPAVVEALAAAVARRQTLEFLAEDLGPLG